MSSLRRRVIGDTLRYTAANYLAMGLGIITSFVTKALLGPAGAGYWALSKVVQSYGEYSDLGTRDAMLREIPQAEGAGKSEEAVKTQDAAFAFTGASSIAAALLIFGGSFFVSDATLRRCLWVVAPLVVLTHVYNYFLTLMRTRKKIKELSAQIVANMAFVSALSILGAWKGGVVGLALGIAAATALSVLLARKLNASQIAPRWDDGIVKRLLGVGLPMVALSYLLITFLSVDALMVGRFLGIEALGLYTIALMTVQQISQLGRFAHIILLPHIQEKYGSSGSLGSSSGLFVRTTYALAFFLPLMIALVLFLVPALVHTFLPAFIGGLPAMKLLAVGYFFVAVNEMSSTVLFTLNEQRRLVPIYAVMVAVSAGLIFTAVQAGWGLEGVAVATGAGYLLFFLAVFGYSFKRLLSGAELARMTAVILALFSYFAALFFLVDSLPVAGPWSAFAFKSVLFALGYSPWILHFEKKEAVLRSVVELLLSKAGRTA